MSMSKLGRRERMDDLLDPGCMFQRHLFIVGIADTDEFVYVFTLAFGLEEKLSTGRVEYLGYLAWMLGIALCAVMEREGRSAMQDEGGRYTGVSGARREREWLSYSRCSGMGSPRIYHS
jgi:hypothetical protein